MTLFMDATKMGRKTLSCTIIWPQRYHFFSGAFCYTLFGIRAQFIIRKEESKVLARRASCDKKTLARQVIPLAPGYRTALSARPDLTHSELILGFGQTMIRANSTWSD